jgi:hypothetical protein
MAGAGVPASKARLPQRHRLSKNLLQKELCDFSDL